MPTLLIVTPASLREKSAVLTGNIREKRVRRGEMQGAVVRREEAFATEIREDTEDENH